MASWKNQGKFKNFIAFGNPLLDYSFKLENNFILQKYNLQNDSQSELSEEVLKNIIADGRKLYLEPDLSSGGSSLNSCKILHQLGHDGILFCGAIGGDSNGLILENIIKDYGINVGLDVKPGTPTGMCVCLINNEHRSLNACIGAAQLFTVDFFHHEKWLECSKKFNNSKDSNIFYIEGYFIPSREHVIEYIMKNLCGLESKNLLAINLNASYIVTNYSNMIRHMVEGADIIFGNRSEFSTLAKIYECQSIQDMVELLMRKESHLERLKIFIVTDASDPVAVYYRSDVDFNCSHHKVRPIPAEKVKDTTGAGDAFVAGFIKKFMLGGSLTECVTMGQEASARVIENIGCNIN